MIHAREDYNRFQDPAVEDPSLLGEGCSPIAEDEPVMLFRARDKHFLDVLRFYRMIVHQDPNRDPYEADRIAEAIEGHLDLARDWRLRNVCKSPDLAPEK